MTPSPHSISLYFVSTLTLTFIALVFLSDAVTASSYQPSDLPNPQADTKAICGRQGLKSAICDPDGYLSQSEADTIDGIINFINSQSNGFSPPTCSTTNKGPTLAVAIISSMSSTGSDKQKAAFQFAKALHDEWGVGDATCQNGVVLFFSISDRAMGVSVGKGLKNVFTDSMLSGYFSNVGQKLRTGEYGKAIVYAVVLVGNILSGKTNLGLQNSSPAGGGMFLAMIAAGAFIGAGVYGRRKKRNRYSDCKKVLQKLDQDRSNADSRQYTATSCPICLEDFEDNQDESRNSNENQKEISNGTTSSSSSNNNTDINQEHVDLMNETGTGKKQEKTSEIKSRRTLSCEHSYHEDCIVKWFSATASNNNSKCPICRAPIMVPSTTQQQGNSNTSRTTTAYPVGWDNGYDDEYRFRIHRVRFLYSDFITTSMMNNWESRRRDTLAFPMASDFAFTATNPVVVAAAYAARTSGQHGSSFSYGGGSSGGGGGGGGSW